MKNFAEDIIKNHTNPSCSDDINLQHLIHLLAGYRAFIKKDKELQPYAPDTARQFSFDHGVAMAKEDSANMPEKFSIQEFKNYINKKYDSYGDVSHFLKAENIREANEPENIEDDENE